MSKHRYFTPAALALAGLLVAAGAAVAQSGGVALGKLSPAEFLEIHGTTDRYELLAQEMKGDCTQCHAQRAETDMSAGVGYLYRRTDGGGETLRPYEELDSHPEAQFDLYHRDPAWGRVHATGEYLGGIDHSARVDLRYKTLVNATATSQGFPHNQEHLSLPGATGETPPEYLPEDQDPGDDYQKGISEQALQLRSGPPEYPAHVRAMVRRYAVSGETQQTFLDANRTTNFDNISQTRDLDQTTTEAEGGADAHLGYGMVSYAYNYTQFRNDENDPEYLYGAAIHGAHPGGISAHNTYPDAHAWEHVVRLSSTQTGQVVASANLSVGRVENEDSEVGRDYYRGEVDLTWRPRTWVSTLLRYRRTHKQDDVSDTAEALREAAGLPAEYQVDEDRYSASVTLRPVARLTLRGDAIRTEYVRTDAEGYAMPANSRKHEWKASAFYRPMRRVSLRGAYQLLLADDETALATTPTKAQRWQAWAGLQPWWFLALNGSWLSVDAENEDANREDQRTVAQANLTLTPMASFSIGGFASRFHNEVTAAVNVSDGVTVRRADDSAPYEATGTQYGAFANWQASERLTLRGQISWLTADGSFSTNSATFGDLGQYSEFDAQQWDLAFDVGYAWENGWGLNGRLVKSDYQQDGAQPEDDEDILEGKLVLSKRW